MANIRNKWLVVVKVKTVYMANIRNTPFQSAFFIPFRFWQHFCSGNQNTLTDDTIGAGSANPSGAPVFIPVFSRARVAQFLVFCVVFFFRSLVAISLFYFDHCIVCPSSIYKFCVVCPSSIYKFCVVCPSSIYKFWYFQTFLTYIIYYYFDLDAA